MGAFTEDVRRHDAAIRALGLEIWTGAEPTFTRRQSEEPWWLGSALGGDKEDWARALLEALAPRLDGPAHLIRAIGRQYPGEDAPRFCLGALWHRDGRAAVASSDLDHAAIAAPGDTPERAWLSVTADPGVVEVNLAPAPDLVTYKRYTEQVCAAARDAGLSPIRFRYNGESADSGGGGQLTFGGPTPLTSPFFRHPRLLPGLLRYLNHHPALSYAFAGECVGSASQGPRPDEGVRERFDELATTLTRLEMAPETHLTPELLWQSLAPLLVDSAGNSHRSEVNIEKLWSPHMAGRGRLGLVELRSLRMQPTPDRQVAVAALFRALLARLVVAPFTEPLRDWGAELHDRFALPTVLAADLHGVLDDLAAHGLGLGPALRGVLTAERRALCTVELGGARLSLRQAVEFWPLVGDVASQEESGARIVDSSLRRLEVRIEGEVPDTGGVGSLTVGAGPVGHPIPLTATAPGVHVAGLRFRAYRPNPGFHPDLGPQDPLQLTWRVGEEARQVTLHQWRPDGGAYDGLPDNATEAARRRSARVVVRALDPADGLPEPPTRTAATQRGPSSSFTTDLRQLPAPGAQ